MITLQETAHLMSPTAAVRVSYLAGEQADCLLRGTDTDWLAPASDDFDDFVRNAAASRTAGTCRRRCSGTSPMSTTWAPWSSATS